MEDRKMADIQKFIEEIKGMTVLELNELVKALEEEFGVSAAAPVAVAAAPAAAADAPAAEEKTEFKVSIKEIGDKKIDVIKAVREFTSLGLGEAKALVEAKGVIKESATKEEADKIIARFKEVGATVVAE
jgi:large subunit ribosomal protein L7/L12